MSIRARNDMENFDANAKDYEQKAMLLLQKGEKGDMDASEADRLATIALVKKDENLKSLEQAKSDQAKFNKSVDQLDQNIKTIRTSVSKWENELKTLKARVKVSSATKNLNKQLAQIDSTDTVAMLEKMKEKVSQEEALAESYGEIANESRSVDQDIDKALEGSKEVKASGDLAALKAKMGLGNKSDDSQA
jgi:phage shock protein A